MAHIHPTAIVHESAQLEPTVKVGPYCVIGADTQIGANTDLLSHVIIDPRTKIGTDCVIHPFAVLGSPPQSVHYNGEETTLTIGDRNIIREHVTMNTGTPNDKGHTDVGSDGFFMTGAHVAHDCVVGNHVTMINNATLAGHVSVGNNVVMGGLSAVHQWVRVGDGAMIGGMTGVERDVIPYGMVTGDRARLGGLNVVGLKRKGVPKSDIHQLRAVYQALFREPGDLKSKIDTFQDIEASQLLVRQMLDFLRAESKRGLLVAAR